MYCASSLFGRVRAGNAALMGPGRRGVEAAVMVAFRDETSAVVLPMRVIFLETSSVRGRVASLKGGF